MTLSSDPEPASDESQPWWRQPASHPSRLGLDGDDDGGDGDRDRNNLDGDGDDGDLDGGGDSSDGDDDGDGVIYSHFTLGENLFAMKSGAVRNISKK